MDTSETAISESSDDNQSEDGQIQKYRCYVTMQNSMMMFKKTVDHPYLINCPLKPGSSPPEVLIDENLVTSSGKMLVLDAMLPRLKKAGHKVIFPI